jgi:hypothetical protein
LLAKSFIFGPNFDCLVLSIFSLMNIHNFSLLVGKVGTLHSEHFEPSRVGCSASELVVSTLTSNLQRILSIVVTLDGVGYSIESPGLSSLSSSIVSNILSESHLV